MVAPKAHGKILGMYSARLCHPVKGARVLLRGSPG